MGTIVLHTRGEVAWDVAWGEWLAWNVTCEWVVVCCAVIAGWEWWREDGERKQQACDDYDYD